MKKNNSCIKNLFSDVRLVPVKARGRGEAIFAAFSAAVVDLGFGDNEVFGIREIPGDPVGKGRRGRG